MPYVALKHLHVTFAYLTLIGFVTRGALMLADSPRLRSKLARIAPHVIDTLLLVCGVALAWQAQLNPLHTPWLATKIALLLAYIGLGTIALKRGKTRTIRGIAFVAALACVLWIFGVAMSKSPGAGLF